MNGCSIGVKLEVHRLNCFIVGLANDWIDGRIWVNISDIFDWSYGGFGARVTVFIGKKSSNT